MLRMQQIDYSGTRATLCVNSLPSYCSFGILIRSDLVAPQQHNLRIRFARRNGILLFEFRDDGWMEMKEVFLRKYALIKTSRDKCHVIRQAYGESLCCEANGTRRSLT